MRFLAPGPGLAALCISRPREGRPQGPRPQVKNWLSFGGQGPGCEVNDCTPSAPSAEGDESEDEAAGERTTRVGRPRGGMKVAARIGLRIARDCEEEEEDADTS